MGVAHHLAVGCPDQPLNLVGGVSRHPLEDFLAALAEAESHIQIATQRHGIASIAVATTHRRKGCATRFSSSETSKILGSIHLCRDTNRDRLIPGQTDKQLAIRSDRGIAASKVLLQGGDAIEGRLG